MTKTCFLFGWKKSKRNVDIGKNVTQWETVKFIAIIQGKWGRETMNNIFRTILDALDIYIERVENSNEYQDSKNPQHDNTVYKYNQLVTAYLIIKDVAAND